jgi:predicted 3-demethylubiquinone-9 3-methyltransferase (glyoxalase superfamily)
MQKITPCLWFDTEGEEAAEFYVSLFGDAKILEVTHYGEAGPRPVGTVMTVSFVLEGQEYMALNGGPEFPFTEAVSFSVSCEDQEEVDRLWARLLEDGGSEVACGWIKDRFGLSWQIIPTALPRLLSDPDQGRAQRAMAAMLQMTKIDVAALEKAADAG